MYTHRPTTPTPLLTPKTQLQQHPTKNQPKNIGEDGIELTLTRRLVRVPDVKLTSFLGPPADGIGYIQLASFSQVCNCYVYICMYIHMQYIHTYMSVYKLCISLHLPHPSIPNTTERPLRDPGLPRPLEGQRAQRPAEGAGAGFAGQPRWPPDLGGGRRLPTSPTG